MIKSLMGAINGACLLKKYTDKNTLCIVINTDNKEIIAHSIIHLKDVLKENEKTELVIFSVVYLSENFLELILDCEYIYIANMEFAESIYAYSKFRKNLMGGLIGKSGNNLRIISNYDYTGLNITGFIEANECNTEYFVCDRLLLLKNIELKNTCDNQLSEIKEHIKCL